MVNGQGRRLNFVRLPLLKGHRLFKIFVMFFKDSFHLEEEFFDIFLLTHRIN